MPSELPLSTHLPTSEGWTAEVVSGLWLAESATALEPTRVKPTRFETLRLMHSATPPYMFKEIKGTHMIPVIFGQRVKIL